MAVQQYPVYDCLSHTTPSMNKMKPLFACCLVIFLLSSCTRYAYYQSPLQANTQGYKAIPLHQEGVASATYASGGFTAGGANELLSDGVWAFLGGLHRSHNFGHFQAYYGLTGSLGSYTVKEVTQSESNVYFNRNLNDSLISQLAGHKFFGTWGANAGINLVLPFDNGGEWRAVGGEVSWNNEFGDYLRFRQKLPDTAANLIDRNRQYFTLSLTTDLILPIKDGSVGFKFSFSGSPRTFNGYNKNRIPTTYSPAYFSQTYHVTKNMVTGYLQLNTGTKAMNIQLGANVRLGPSQQIKKAGR